MDLREDYFRMKKYVTYITFIIFVFLILYLLLKYVFLFPWAYKGNKYLSREVNSSIKTVVLSSVKDMYSKLFIVDRSKIYTKDCLNSNSHVENTDKGIFVLIDPNFMDSVQKKNENKYIVIVPIKNPFSDNYILHYIVQENNGEYTITNVLLDI